LKFLGVTILQGVQFPIFLLIFEWALQQCSATALPVKTRTLSPANVTEGNIVKKNVTIQSTAKRFIYSMSAYE